MSPQSTGREWRGLPALLLVVFLLLCPGNALAAPHDSTGGAAAGMTASQGVYDRPAPMAQPLQVGSNGLAVDAAAPARQSSTVARERAVTAVPRVAAKGEGAGSEIFFRTMSKAHVNELHSTGRLPATAETFISPSAGFSSAYEGVMVQFTMRSGTTNALAGIGVRDASAAAAGAFPNMPLVSRGWTATSAFFKGEGGIVNIGLGRGTALDVFNDAIQSFRVL